VLITPHPTSPLLAGVLSSHTLKVLKVPSIHDLLNGKTSPYPFTKTFEEAKHEPFLVLHTSGSTGMPKPIL
jgi:acyl-coenzyme A synthetase/AMP-(fatty) acid ligase